MSDNFNPYQTPNATLTKQTLDNLSVDAKNILFVPFDNDLPPCCIKCGKEVTGNIKTRKMWWHHSGWYLLILINILIYALVAVAVRKKTSLSVGLCEEHARSRKKKIFGWLALSIVTFMLPIFSLSWEGDYEAMRVILFVISVISLMAAALSSSLIRLIRIDKSGAYIKGLPEAYLDGIRKQNP